MIQIRTLKLLLQIIQCKKIQDREKRKGWNEWMQVPLAFIDFYTTPKSLSIQFSQAETTWKERVGNDLRLNNNSSVQTKNISLTNSAFDSQELGAEWFWICEYKCSSSSTVISPLLRAIETGYCNLLWKQPWNSEGSTPTEDNGHLHSWCLTQLESHLQTVTITSSHPPSSIQHLF